MKNEVIEIMEKRHKRQENYKGFQLPNRSNHKTGIILLCASCHQPWPCDVRKLLDALLDKP